ncbi:MAG: hypothetical protein HWQ43_17440 [Nostoc sp. JL31]|uniref:hypothetical protein n=1 Tax=Nostoc sp. JL31 TaxID=2815395 RepID=UPI0025CE1181|nr:hypothetical protein [Nostoc sp. JL31]MBN3890854.1 hypothetical protein [Nostoc sp. JL31]
MAVAGAFTQAKTSTNNFSVIPQKIAKVNSLVLDCTVASLTGTATGCAPAAESV